MGYEHSKAQHLIQNGLMVHHAAGLDDIVRQDTAHHRICATCPKTILPKPNVKATELFQSCSLRTVLLDLVTRMVYPQWPIHQETK